MNNSMFDFGVIVGATLGVCIGVALDIIVRLLVQDIFSWCEKYRAKKCAHQNDERVKGARAWLRANYK